MRIRSQFFIFFQFSPFLLFSTVFSVPDPTEQLCYCRRNRGLLAKETNCEIDKSPYASLCFSLIQNGAKSNLTELIMAHMEIEEIPDGILTPFQKLEHLDFSFNKIEDIWPNVLAGNTKE